MNKLGAIVLCGGESRRMGRPKPELRIGGETLLARVVRTLRPRVDPVVVVSAEGRRLPALPDGCVVAFDAVAGRGPLQGMSAGFATLPPETEFAYVTSADVPYPSVAWIDRLTELIGDDDLVLPRVGGHHHPLSALYRVATIGPEVDRLLAEGRPRPFFLTERRRARIATEEELAPADPTFRTLRNLNTPADYHAALDEAGIGPPPVMVELFGVPRMRAGFASLEVRARFVSEALAALGDAAPALRTVLSDPSLTARTLKLNIDGDRFVTPEAMLAEGDHLLVFSADVGG